MITIPERVTPQNEALRKALDAVKASIRVSSPGIIQSFSVNDGVPTVTVQLAIREKIVVNGTQSTDRMVQDETIPIIVDVPIVIPDSGDYLLCFPAVVGSECLVVFGDRCMDAWWQSGGVQNQMDRRFHDLSDGYAILGIRNQTREIPNYPTESIQLRNQAGDTYLEIKSQDHNLVVAGNWNVTVKGNLVEEIDGNVTRTVKGELTETVQGAVSRTYQSTVTETITGNFTSTSPQYTFNGPVSAYNFTSTGAGGYTTSTLNGSLHTTGHIQVDQNVAAAGDVTAGAISVESHVHTGVTPGSNNTGGPTG